MTVSVWLHAYEDDPAEIDRLTRQFRQELYALDADVTMVSSQDEAPPGAKGDPATVTALAALLASPTVLVGLCQLAKSWVTRGDHRRIVIKDGARKLELTGGTDAQHQQLIDAFLAGEAHDSGTGALPPAAE
jgi:hypothetical protein